MAEHRIFAMPFAKVYPLYVQKAERGTARRRSRPGHLLVDRLRPCGIAAADRPGTTSPPSRKPCDAPGTRRRSPAWSAACVWRRSNPTQLMQKIRWLDKLVDELAKGRKMEKILRQ